MFLCLSILSPFFHTSAPTDAASQRHHKVIYNDFPVFNYTYIYCHAPLCFYFSIFSLCVRICVCVRRQFCGVGSLLHLHGFQESNSDFQASDPLTRGILPHTIIHCFSPFLRCKLQRHPLSKPHSVVPQGLAMCSFQNKYQPRTC